jgi:hypothetical protein
MAKHQKREEALMLRKNGFSYSQIKDTLGVSKGTLSIWLRHLPLSKKRISELRDTNEKRIELFRNTMKAKRNEVIKKAFVQEEKSIGTFSKRDLKLIAISLYWAEGTKTWDSKTEITNSDPYLLSVFIKWMVDEGVPKEKVKVALHLYEVMDVAKEVLFWSKALGIPKDQFYTPRIKKTSRVFHRGKSGHGTCQVIFGNRQFNDRMYAAVTQLSSLGKRVE